jgi:hypothetical protein
MPYLSKKYRSVKSVTVNEYLGQVGAVIASIYTQIKLHRLVLADISGNFRQRYAAF